MRRREVAKALTRRISRGLKRRPPGGPPSWSEVRKMAVSTLRAYGWRLDTIRKKEWAAWRIRSRMQRVGDVSVVIWYELKYIGEGQIARTNIEIWAFDKSENLIGHEGVGQMVRPRDIVRTLREEIEYQAALAKEGEFDY